MEVRFRSNDLDRLEADPSFDAGLPQAVVSKYRQRLAIIREAEDERVLYNLKSLRFEKLKGKRSQQRSIRLNDQWRLVIEIQKGEPKNTAIVVDVEDYH